ncbi:MAG: methyl-accepting chemotaxis protein [Bradymonadia bacterium]
MGCHIGLLVAIAWAPMVVGFVAVAISLGCLVMAHRSREASEPVSGYEALSEITAATACDAVEEAQEGSQPSEHDIEVSTLSEQLVEMGRLLESNVFSLLQQVDFSAEMVENASIETSEVAMNSQARNSEITDMARNASDHMQALAGSTEEMTATISEIARLTTESSETAQEAVSEMQHTAEVVNGLSDAVQSIGHVSGLIEAIAKKTNLLALNATIEAARAGEAGKGFAVVADEVKSLARQTSDATEQIGAEIEEVQRVTLQVVETIKVIGHTIDEINQSVGSISGAVVQQEATTREISGHIQKTVEDAEGIASAVSKVDEMLDDATGHASQSLCASSVLKTTSNQLSGEVVTFLTALRKSHVGNRRKYPRVHVQGLWGTLSAEGETHRVLLQELSRSGCRVHQPEDAPELLKVGQSITLSLEGTPHGLEGSVVWVKEDESGFVFDSLAPEWLSDLMGQYQRPQEAETGAVETWL